MMPLELCEEFESLSLGFLYHTTVATFEAEPTLEQGINKHQKEDEKLQEIRESLKKGEAPNFKEDDRAYSIHPRSTKMYYDLKERFRWPRMKRSVAEYVAVCDTCQRVKAEHKRPAGLLQPLKVLEWKWEDITMDFIVQDWQNYTYPGLYVYMEYPRGSYLTKDHSSLRFWEQLHDSLDTKLRFSTSYHPQTDGQTERTNQVDDFVYLKVSPMRGVRRFNMKGKLAPRYIGPFRILEKKGEVAYRLELPLNLSGVHDVFHVSQLKKCLRVPEEQAPLEGLNVQEDLTYTEHPVKILETSERVTRNKRIKMCRVQWSHHTEKEATWEREDEMREAYPDLFASQPM
ncbi:hypothetical protein U9M48_040138 [Paspalum notatum var. saurae]|uniref:Uncharacterized protein n=1 Tax=Paspalum notatum var. saurae TaxID=547442 RepID=A0AAQ3UQC9_PASNO